MAISYITTSLNAYKPISNSIFSYVLVTGATGFIGAHVVDNLLNRGMRVRAVARSRGKAKFMLESRSKYASQLEFFFIDDLATPSVFDEALKGVDGVIHVASVSHDQ